MNDTHPYRIPAAYVYAGKSMIAHASEADYSRLFGRGVLRAIPANRITADGMRCFFGTMEVWHDDRFGVWVARSYNPRGSRWMRRIYMLPLSGPPTTLEGPNGTPLS